MNEDILKEIEQMEYTENGEQFHIDAFYGKNNQEKSLEILTICYKLVSSVCEPIADGKIVNLLEQIGDIFKILLAILASISFMVIIGTTLVIKISNSGMMYR